MNALCVDPARIDEIWPHVAEFIAQAFWNGRGDDDAETVLADLKSGHSLLWIVWAQDETRILAAATTKLINVARGRICRITACGGRDLKRWKACIADIETYAKAEGCDHVRIEGRRGWQMILPDYAQPWIVLEKPL